MKRKRAMVMIFVVILIACITTVLAATVDLGRIGALKQRQRERDAKWAYCVDSARALVGEGLWSSATYNQNFNRTVNGVDLTVSSALDSSFNANGVKIITTGTMDGKSRTSTSYMGKRAYVNPCVFGMFFTSTMTMKKTSTLTGDLYYRTTLTDSKLGVTGNVFTPNTTSPIFTSMTGSFVPRQPGFTIAFNDAAYQAAASSVITKDTTVNNPTNLLSLGKADLRFIQGKLTIKGVVTGEIVYYVSGSVNIQGVSLSLTGVSRLVIICNGDVQIQGGAKSIFVVCNGAITNGGGGANIITGSLCGGTFDDKDQSWTVVYDNYFEANADAGNRYWIPGQW